MKQKPVTQEPCTFAVFAEIHTELSRNRGHAPVLNEFGIDSKTWHKYSTYWNKRISADKKLQLKFKTFTENIIRKNKHK